MQPMSDILAVRPSNNVHLQLIILPDFGELLDTILFSSARDAPSKAEEVQSLFTVFVSICSFLKFLGRHFASAAQLRLSRVSWCFLDHWGPIW